MNRGGVVLLLLALLAGGVCGYVLRHVAGRPGDVSVAPASVAPEPRVAGSGPERDQMPEYPPLPRGAAPPADVISGRGVVTGVVRTADGDPLAGVLVRAELRMSWRSPSRTRTGVPSGQDLDEAIQGMADRDRFRREVTREAVTGSDGSYVLSGLADQRYLLRAWLRGWSIAPDARQTRVCAPGDIRNFRAHRGVAVEVSLLLPDGTVPESAYLVFDSGNRRESHGWRPEDPVILSRPGTWRVTITAGVLREFELIVDALALAEDEEDRAVTFRLGMKPGIAGRIHGVGNPPERRFEVRYLQVPPQEDPDLKRLRRDGKKLTIRTDPEHGFGVFGIPDGRYTVALIGDGRVLDVETIELEGKPLSLDLTAPPFDPTEYVTVRMESPEGKLLEVGHVATLFLPDDLSGGGVSVGMGYPEDDGSFRVHHPERLPEDAEKPGRYFLEVSSHTHGSRRVPYPGPTAPTATVRFESPAKLTIALDGYDRKEYLGHTEIHMMREEHGQFVHQASPGVYEIDLDGKKIYAPLSPGRYEIEVRSKHGAAFGFTVLKVPIELVTGEQIRKISLPDLHTLTLLVPGAEPGTAFRVREPVSGFYRYDSEEERPRDGRVTFVPMPSGDYIVTARRNGVPDRTMKLQVTRSAEILFQPD